MPIGKWLCMAKKIISVQRMVLALGLSFFVVSSSHSMQKELPQTLPIQQVESRDCRGCQKMVPTQNNLYVLHAQESNSRCGYQLCRQCLADVYTETPYKTLYDSSDKKLYLKCPACLQLRQIEVEMSKWERLLHNGRVIGDSVAPLVSSLVIDKLCPFDPELIKVLVDGFGYGHVIDSIERTLPVSGVYAQTSVSVRQALIDLVLSTYKVRFRHPTKYLSILCRDPLFGAGVSTVLSPGTSPLPSVVRRAGTLIGISLMSAVFAPGHTPQYPFFAGLSMYVTAECLARMYSTLHAPKLTWSVASKGYSVANGVWALIQRVYATVFVNGTTMTKAGWPHGPSGQQKVLNALLLPCSIALGVHLFGADGFKNVPEVLREHLLQLRKK